MSTSTPQNLPGGYPRASYTEGPAPGPPPVAGSDGTVGGPGGTPLNAAALQAPVTAALGAIFLDGLYADLPAAATQGRYYYATDQNRLLYDTGSAWEDIPVNGPWTALTLGTNINSTTTGGTAPDQGQTAGARREGGNVRLRGGLVATAAIASAATLATIPTALRPATLLTVPGVLYTSAASYTSIAVALTTAGLIYTFAALTTSSVVYLDAITYSVT